MKILLFSHDPGGANTIFPLVIPLKNRQHDIYLYGEQISLNKYKQFGLEGKSLLSELAHIDQQNIEVFIKKYQFNCIVTGTSANDFTEKFIWQAAEKLQIPAFAILDQWINYGIRFSPYPLSEIEDYNKNKKISFLPNKIFVMDDFAKTEMALDGVPEDRIVVTGHPYFEYLTSHKKQCVKNSNNIQKNNQEFVITYASEPLSQSGNYLGYTELTIFQNLLNIIKEITSKHHKQVKIIIRPHPREKDNTYQEIIAQENFSRVTLELNRTTPSLNLIMQSDLICGMSSMFLLESVILGKPILSIQMGLKQKNPFILAQRNLCTTILDQNILLSILNLAILNGVMPTNNFAFASNGIQKIICYLEKNISGEK